MSNSFFPDGFPQDPGQAIEASFFLTEAEKQEWRTWLLTANENEKSEFVDTLHSIFIDQKSSQPNQQISEQNNFQPNLDISSNLNNPAPLQNPFSNPAPQPSQFDNGISLQNANAFGPSNIPNNVQFGQPIAPMPAMTNSNFGEMVNQNPLPNNFFQDQQNQFNPNLNPLPVFNPSPVQPQGLTQTPNQGFVPNQTQNQTQIQNQTQSQPFGQFTPQMEAPTQQFVNEPVNNSTDNNDLDFDFSDLERELQMQDILNNDEVETNIETDNSNQYMPEEVAPTPEPVTQAPRPIVDFKPANNFDYTSDNSPKSPILKKPANMEYNLEKMQNDKLKNEVDTMLTPTIKNSQISPTLEYLEDDYEEETVNKDEKYQKVAEISLLSAKQVSELYTTFLETQGQSAKLEMEFKDKQSRLFDKIMEMVTEASILSDKVLRLNDQVVNQAGDIHALKVATNTKGSVSLQSQVNSLREEIRKVERSLSFSLEAIEREFSDFREDISSRIEDMSIQLTSAIADTYKVDGTYEKLAKLSARMDLIDGGRSVEMDKSELYANAKKTLKTPSSKTLSDELDEEASEKSKSKSSISIRRLKSSNTKSE